MINKTIDLKDEFPMLGKAVKLISYCPDNFAEFSQGRRRKTLLLLPGGAYRYNCPREGESVTLRFLAYDINVFLLDYNHGPYLPPYPFVEGSAAIAYLRRHAEEYHVDVDGVGVIGFSAGGHFAASLGAFYSKAKYAAFLSSRADEIKPNALLLGYPVIDMDAHQETADNLLLNAPEKKDEYCIEKQVNPSFPPSFIWANNDDSDVSSLNSLLLAIALKQNGVRFELHHYAYGIHGGSIAEPYIYPDNVDPQRLQEAAYCHNWVELALRFIEKVL